MSSTYDVGVVGGGAAGSIAAMLLARAGVHVALFEATDLESPRIGETQPPEINPLLERLGISHVVSDAVACPGLVSVWGSPLLLERDYLSNRFGNGWHVDRNIFDRALCNEAAYAGADVSLGTWVRPYRQNGAWVVGLGGSEIRTRFIVDATGRNGLRLHSEDGWLTDDSLVAIYLRLSTPPSSDKRGLIESSPDGWWYSAPLPHDKYMASYTTDPIEYSAHGVSLSEHLSLAPATASRISASHILHQAPVRVTSGVRRRICSEDWAAVGDAAVAHDPISGRGMLHAIESAEAFAERFLSSDLQQYEFEERSAFARYRVARRKHYSGEKRWGARPFWRRRHVGRLEVTAKHV